MSGPEGELTPEQQVEAAALSLGRTILGRDLDAEEAAALTSIFRSSVQALREGYIRRLADHVAAERADEAVEDFFGSQINPD